MWTSPHIQALYFYLQSSALGPKPDVILPFYAGSRGPSPETVGKNPADEQENRIIIVSIMGIYHYYQRYFVKVEKHELFYFYQYVDIAAIVHY